MEIFRKPHRLSIGVLAIAVLATIGVSPALAGASGRTAVSQHFKVRTHGRAHRFARRRAAAQASAVVTASATVSSAVAAGVTPAIKPTGSSSSGACPSNPAGFLEAENVGASATNDKGNTTTTYLFESFFEENTGNGTGVPGLIKYCVYPSSGPKAIKVTAHGEDNEPWLVVQKGKTPAFSFTRPGGNASNIPLDGNDHEMGTATWSDGKAPQGQVILLHINDPAVCEGLYGTETPGTCFVKPGERPEAICDAGAGSTLFAYNALPTDFLTGCPGPPSHAFEAQQTSEFGDKVVLDGSGKIESMTVDFQSYACENGAWNKGKTDPCETKGTEGFTIPASGTDPAGITAHIYKVGAGGTVGEEIGRATNKDPIPYRPSADPVKCAGGADGEQEDNSMWFNPATEKCVRSLTVLIPFDFSTGLKGEVPVGGEVIWTVTFNTSHYGYNPLAPQSCNSEPGGCGYDSLNVGTKSYENAPYAGEDVDPDEVIINRTSNPASLGEESGWTGYRPLAQITTGP